MLLRFEFVPSHIGHRGITKANPKLRSEKLHADDFSNIDWLHY